jgi:hypothetical protein
MYFEWVILVFRLPQNSHVTKKTNENARGNLKMQICHFVLFWACVQQKDGKLGQGRARGCFQAATMCARGRLLRIICMTHFSNAISQTPALPNKAA